jgi:hypothetical protein
MCMYVCMCMLVCMYECMYLFTCVYECINVCMYACMYVRMYVCKYLGHCASYKVHISRINWSRLLLSNILITLRARGVPVGECIPCNTTLLHPRPIVSPISISSYSRLNVFGLFFIAMPFALMATLPLTNMSPAK